MRFNSLVSELFDTYLDTDYDIKDSKDGYTVTVDVPGIPKSALNIELVNRTLTISGERKCGNRSAKVHREFIVPSGTSTEDISAACEDGVLTLTVAKPKTQRASKVVIT